MSRTTTDVIAESLVSELDRDELFDLVVALDAKVGHWPFTLRLANHFEDLRMVQKIEEALDKANSDKPDIVGGIKVLA